MNETELVKEVKSLRTEVAELKSLVEILVRNTPGPIPGRRCTIHENCGGGTDYCNDGGPVTDHGIGW